MAYKKVSGSRTAEIQLDGSVYTVDFGCSYNYYAVRNDSSGVIYVSTTDKSCTPNNDGVVSIPSGGGYVHYNGFGGSSEIFISGNGSAVIIAQEDGICPFKTAAKGGDSDGSIDLSDYALEADLTSHTDNESNPHNVTAKQIKYGNVVDMYNQPISYLQNTILNWLRTAVEALSVFRFYGNNNIDFYVNNWEDNPSAKDTGDRSIYTVKMLGSASGVGGRYLFATFLITTTIPRRNGNYSTDSFMVTYSDPYWYMYGRLVTEKSNMLLSVNDRAKLDSIMVVLH